MYFKKKIIFISSFHFNWINGLYVDDVLFALQHTFSIKVLYFCFFHFSHQFSNNHVLEFHFVVVGLSFCIHFVFMRECWLVVFSELQMKHRKGATMGKFHQNYQLKVLDAKGCVFSNQHYWAQMGQNWVNVNILIIDLTSAAFSWYDSSHQVPLNTKTLNC